MMWKKTLSWVLTMMATTQLLAAPGYAEQEGEPLLREIEAEAYTAVLNVSAGEMTFQSRAHAGTGWNGTQPGLVPGACMLMDEQGFVRRAAVEPVKLLSSGDAREGAAGVQMSGEVAGTKSWFFFDDEIVCVGAGLENAAGTQERLIQAVDHVRVDESTRAALTNPANGYRNILEAVASVDERYSWAPLVDQVTRAKHTRNWLTASGLPVSSAGKPIEWSYVFPTSITDAQVFYRMVKGEAPRVQSFELWTEPVGGAYAYTLGAGGMQESFQNSQPAQVKAQILSNTQELQAVERSEDSVVAVNKWIDGEVQVENSVADLTLYSASSVLLKKDAADQSLTVTVAKPQVETGAVIELLVHTDAQQAQELGNAGVLIETVVEKGGLRLRLDCEKMDTAAVIRIQQKQLEEVQGEEITMVRGESVKINRPDELSGALEWGVYFAKHDGTLLRNAGYQKIKRELKEGEADGNRRAGDTSAAHLLEVKRTDDGAVLTAKNKGCAVVQAKDAQGRKKQWKVEVLYEAPENLPRAEFEDFARIRTVWKESMIGKDLLHQEGGSEILNEINREAQSIWQRYAYRGQERCEGIPWPEDEGAKGNPNIPYEDDAVEFRPAFKSVLALSKAYAAQGGELYQNTALLKDITNILDYLTGVCYVPKTQTDNWWTWEIGIPKDLVPTLLLISDALSPEQREMYTKALYFFQPDPFHEGVIGTASTHGQGYRTAQGANLIDCATTAIGLGAVMEDNEQVYLGMLASSGTFVINRVQDSTVIAQTGYVSGFYPDGSYLDHGRVPYLGAYGIEFMKGAAKIPALLAATPWQYPLHIQKNLESYVIEGFGIGMYRGMMLDAFKGRSVSRPKSSNRDAGRDAMKITLQMLDSFSEEARARVLPMLKDWIQHDPDFMGLLTGAENIAIRQKAREILQDDSIQADVSAMHRSYPLMDRAVHRTKQYLFALSMYSERIQNTEVINHENRLGWHQGSGMTYLYDEDEQYTDAFWNTVNPYRLAGTTVVPVNIGTGRPDSSGFAQGGDYLSRESWVGGSAIGSNGISGMSFSGETVGLAGDASVSYAPHLRGKKSWFMLGDEIICLGAGIENRGMELPVETTIENRKLGQEAGNRLLVNGTQVDLALEKVRLQEIVEKTADTSGKVLENVRWAHLEGVKSAGVGYYFPEEFTSIRARRTQTTGNWSDVGTSEGESTQSYLEMWFDHGVNPENAKYSYVLLPGMTSAQVQAYAHKPSVEILENSAQVQAVRHRELGIMGANVWSLQGASLEGFEVDGACSVMVQTGSDGTLTVALSDPTMKNTGRIRVVLDMDVARARHLDENIHFEKLEQGRAALTVDLRGTNGESSTAVLELEKDTVLEASRGQLRSLIERADQLEIDAYTPESVRAFQEALEKAKVMLEHEMATVQDLEEAAQALRRAMDDLILKEELHGAREVMSMIDGIGFVTLEKRFEIERARAAYEALSERQKALVVNYEILLQAEETLRQLQSEVNAGEETIVNEQYGIQLTAKGLTLDMELRIQPMSRQDSWVKRVQGILKDDEEILALYEVKLMKGAQEIGLPTQGVLSILIGEKYNGRKLEVISEPTLVRSVVRQSVIVEKGSLRAEVSALGRFAVIGRAVSEPAGQTGSVTQGGNVSSGLVAETGDSTPVAALTVLCSVSGVILVAFYTRKKRMK